MTSGIDALCDSIAQLEPEAMFSAMWKIRNRVMDTWCDAAERVVRKHLPDAISIHPSVVVCDEYGDYADSMTVEMQDGTSLILPHLAHLYVEELTQQQVGRVNALKKRVVDAEPAPCDDAVLTVIGEAHGFTLEAFRAVLAAASDLVDLAIDQNEPVILLRLSTDEPLAA